MATTPKLASSQVPLLVGPLRWWRLPVTQQPRFRHPAKAAATTTGLRRGPLTRGRARTPPSSLIGPTTRSPPVRPIAPGHRHGEMAKRLSPFTALAADEPPSLGPATKVTEPPALIATVPLRLFVRLVGRRQLWRLLRRLPKWLLWRLIRRQPRLPASPPTGRTPATPLPR